MKDFLLANPAQFAQGRSAVKEMSDLEFWLTGKALPLADGVPPQAPVDQLPGFGNEGNEGKERWQPNVWIEDGVRALIYGTQLTYEQGKRAARRLTPRLAGSVADEVPSFGEVPEPRDPAEGAHPLPAVGPPEREDAETNARIEELKKKVPSGVDQGPRARSFIGRVVTAPFRMADMLAANAAAAVAGAAIAGPPGAFLGPLLSNTYAIEGPLADELQQVKGPNGEPIDPDTAFHLANVTALVEGTLFTIGVGPLLRPGTGAIIGKLTNRSAAAFLASRTGQDLMLRAPSRAGRSMPRASWRWASPRRPPRTPSSSRAWRSTRPRSTTATR